MLRANKSRISRIFTKIPTLETSRLTLRRMKTSDSRDMFEYASNPIVTRYLLWYPHENLRFTRDWLEEIQRQYRNGSFYDWAIVCREDERMIGTCGFTQFFESDNRAEIGYVLNPAYWGCGYAAEAAARVIAFGFEELRLNRIEARYMAGNTQSRRVMEKCGMVYEGMQRSLMYVKDEYKDIGMCSILYNEYIKYKQGAALIQTKG